MKKYLRLANKIELTISKAKCRKAPGIDNILVEEVKCSTQGYGIKMLHKLFNEIWIQEKTTEALAYSVTALNFFSIIL